MNRDKVRALGPGMDYDKEMLISQEAKMELIWWKTNLVKVNGKDIRPQKISIYIETDASTLGWGARLDDKQTGGRWTISESTNHINLLELKAIGYALFSLCRDMSNVHICIRSDSVTAVTYINNKGGSIVSLFLEAKQIWLWCSERNINISCVHIKGKDNVTADNLSRNFSDSTEWKLNERVFSLICSQTFTPDIDLFASRLNKQLDRFVSWKPDPEAYIIDAFSISWSHFKPFIFPPFSLLTRVIMKIQEEKVEKAILMVPYWTTQPLFPQLLNILIEKPLLLRPQKSLLRLVHNNQPHELNLRKRFLVACVVSGIHTKREEFLSKLPKSSIIHGEKVLQNSTTWLGKNGYFGVIQGKSIPWRYLKYSY